LKYRYSIEKLHAGSSLGSSFTFVQLDKQSNIHGVWSSIDNSFYLGNMLIDFSADSEEIHARETTSDPSGQITLFETNGMQVTKRVWLQFSDDVNTLREDLHWKFLCVFKIPAKNRQLNVIVYDGVLYTDMEVKSELPTWVGNFRELENSNEVMEFEFSDKIGTRVFAFSPSRFEGNISIRLNAHSKKVSMKLNQNEMKEVLVNEAD
jgi:hypothetical protein